MTLIGAQFQATVDNRNNAGVGFFGGPFVGPPANVDTGIEFSIPLAQLGWDGVSPIRIGGFINGQSNDYLSNQIVGGVPSTQGNLGGDGFGTYTGSLAGINFGSIAGNQYVTFPSVPTVPIGNVGNAADFTGFGAVSYAFNIGQTEVTNTQYAAFLNAVAAADPNGLYNTEMAGTFGGITRAGAPGSYTYATISGRENNPVNFVSFWDACRFANWMHNGQPTGAQGAGTTEDGAYTLTPTGIANNTVTRNSNWRWAVTSEDEWYKAAYFQPTSAGGDSDNYWLYPTSSNNAPTTGQANFNNAVGNTTAVGSYPANYYGTFDMAGNAWEWNEAVLSAIYRGLRGGSFIGNEMRADDRNIRVQPPFENTDIGFRVSQAVEAPPPVQRPNLRPTVAAGPSGDVVTINPTANVPFTYTAQNFGPGPVPASATWVDAAYLSVDTSIDAGDFRVEDLRAFGLAVNGTYAINGTFTGIPPGTYNLIVRVNDTGTLDEGGQTSDNALVAASQVRVVEPVIDLAVATPNVSPAPVTDLYPVTITASVTASGTNIASSARGTLVLVDRGGPGGAERQTVLTTATLSFTGTVGGGATQTLAFSGVLPVSPVAPAAIVASIDQLSASARRDDAANNSAARSITVVPAPDLAAFQVTVFTPIVQGSAAPVAGIGRNVSSTALPTSSWTDRIYLSSDDTPSADDLQYDVAQSRSLASNGLYAINAQVGETAVAGEYFVILVCNVNSSFAEASRANNTLVAGTKLVVRARANLRPVGVTLAGGTDLPQGAPANVRWTDQNDGPGVANGPWTDRVVLSKNAVFGDADDRPFPSVSAGPASLAVNAGAEVQQTITIPIDPLLPPGNYSLFVQTNVSGGPPETTTDDNVSAPLSVRIVRPPAANLVAASPSVPLEAIGGQTIQICWTTENRGDANANGPWTTRLYLSADRTLDTSGANADVLLDEFSVRPPTIALAPGQQTTQCELITLPRIVGERYLIAWVNPDGVVQEYLDTVDNVAASVSAISIQPEPTPDLTVPSVSPLGGPDVSVFAGSTVTATFRVLNDNDPSRADSATGATSTPVWFDRLYLSPNNAVRDASDIELGRPAENQIFLRPGESYVQNLSVKLPDDVFGATFHLIAETDTTNAAAETNEANNRGASPAFAIALAPQPDLVAAEVSSPLFNLPEASVGTGAPLPVTWAETNSNALERSGGSTPSVAWSTRVYLSRSAEAQPPSGDDVVIGESVRPRSTALAAGSADPARSATFQVPLSMAGGEYYIKVQVDSGNQVIERTLEGNNIAVSARTLTVRRSAPNLVPTRVQGAPTVVPGGLLTASHTVENRGDDAPVNGQWTDRLVLSLDQTFDASDVSLTPEVPRNSGGLGTIEGTDNEGYVVTQGYRVPGTITPGRYWLGVRVNATNSLNEQSATTDGRLDNDLFSLVPIDVPARYADLSISTPAAATLTAAPGASVRVEWSVANVGDATTIASTWTDEVVLSRDQTFAGAVRSLASAGRTGELTPGASYSAARVVTLPAVGAGEYFLVVRTDSGGAVLQKPVDSAPDTVAIPLRITPEIADLTVASVTPTPASLIGGERLNITFRVSNSGSRATIGNSWLDRVVVRAAGGGPVLASADTTRVGALAPQGSYQRAVDFDLPLGAEGPFDVLVTTDALGGVPEGDETNNAAQGSISVTAAPPSNLVAETPEAPSAVDAGRSFVVTWSVRNESDEPTSADAWEDELWLSRDMTLGAGDIRLFSRRITGGLGPNAAYPAPQSATVTMPAGASGAYRVLLRTNADGRVYERGATADNISASEPVAVGTANLAPTGVGPDLGSVAAGRELPVSWGARNSGQAGVPVAAWRDTVYLSRNQTLDASDVLLGSATRSGPLGGGEAYSASASFRVPASLNGPYFVIVQVNSDRSVPEPGGEGDNVRASSTLIDVTLPDPPDLVVSGVTAPLVAPLGLPATYRWRVGNSPEADGALEGAWEDSIFLSRDALWDPSDVFVGRFPIVLGSAIMPGESLLRSASPTTPAVLPGDYYAVVRGDSRKFLAQTDREPGNDDSSSPAPFPVTIAEISPPGEFANSDLFTSGAERYFAVTGVESGRTLRIAFDHASPSALSELYVSRERIPTAGEFDLSFDRPGESSQRVIVPLTDRPTYYVMVRAAGLTDLPGGVVRAEYLPFSILSVSSTSVGAGEVSLRIRGAQMPIGTAFALTPTAEGPGVAPVRVVSTGVFEFLVTFDLSGREGEFALSATLGALSDTFATPISVTSGGSAQLSVEVAGVSTAKVGVPVQGLITVVNSGTIDVQVGELIASLPRIGEGAATLTLFPDDADRRTSVSSFGAAQAPEVARLFLGRVHPQQLITIPYALTFNAQVPGGMGIAIGGHARSRAEYERTVERVVVSAADQFRLSLLTSGVDPAEAQSARDEFSTLALNAYESAIVEAGGDEGEIASLVWSALEASPRPDAAFFAAWLPEVASRIATARFCPPAGNCAVRDQAVQGVRDLLGCVGCVPAIDTRDVFFGGDAIRIALDGCSEAEALSRDGSGRTLRPALPGECWPPPVASYDPNQTTGPGRGDQRWISPRRRGVWSVTFQNDSQATAPAAAVQVTTPLSSGLQPGSYRGESVVVGEREEDVSGGAFSGLATLPELPTERGVSVSAKVNTTVRPGTETSFEALWQLVTIDPTIAEPPSDPFSGFLPRESLELSGTGTVRFSMLAAPLPTGSRFETFADIVFDDNPPIRTNTVFNTIDSDDPVSAIDAESAPPQALEGGQVVLNFSASDVGSGLEGVRVLVQVDGGPYRIFQPLTTGTTALFDEIEPGRIYGFATQAVDIASNVEGLPIVPDAITVVPTLRLDPASDTGQPGDSVTALTTPRFLIVSIPNRSLPISIRRQSVTVLEATVQTDAAGRGTFEVPASRALLDGMHTVVLRSDAVESPLEVTIASAAPQVAGWTAIRSHGVVGEAALALPIGQPVSEPRAGGIETIEISLTGTIDPASVTPGSLRISGADATGAAIDVSSNLVAFSVSADLRTLRASIAPSLSVPGVYCLQIVDVRSPSGTPIAAGPPVSVTVLPGDVRGDERTNANDVAIVRALAAELDGAPIDPTNPTHLRADIDTDGDVDAADVATTRSAARLDLRGVRRPCGVLNPPFVSAPGSGTTRQASGGSALHDDARRATRPSGVGPGQNASAPTEHEGLSTPGPTLPAGPELGALFAGFEHIPTRAQALLAVFDRSLMLDASAVAAAGQVPVPRVSPLPMRGWWLIELEPGADEARVRSALEARGLYTSPVLVGQGALRMFVLPGLIGEQHGAMPAGIRVSPIAGVISRIEPEVRRAEELALIAQRLRELGAARDCEPELAVIGPAGEIDRAPAAEPGSGEVPIPLVALGLEAHAPNARLVALERTMTEMGFMRARFVSAPVMPLSVFSDARRTIARTSDVLGALERLAEAGPGVLLETTGASRVGSPMIHRALSSLAARGWSVVVGDDRSAILLAAPGRAELRRTTPATILAAAAALARTRSDQPQADDVLTMLRSLE
ncbi:MAG: CARDB domain-containing protein [Planctomycetota bacterium]|nr:CARDB domain-containing protein [Planctomycetota bacterium]